ncbi:heme-binding domain-containing protein [Nannocystaceae bacterium ST9]
MNAKTLASRGGLALLAVALLIQLVPYGRDHTNPALVAEPAWDSPATRELAVRACYDCHSNETKWPWYTNVAPVSWLIQDHVDEGRETLNFSEWDRPQREAHEAGEAVAEGEMPIANYLWMHPEAELSASEQEALVRGLDATLGEHGSRGGRDHDDDD